MRVAGRDAGSVGTGQKISLDDATDDLNTHTVQWPKRQTRSQ